MTTTNFLTLEYLKEVAPITQALANQTDLLLPFIEVGESMHVFDLLGVALKDDLISKIESQNITGNTQTLIENYIIPCSAWWCYFEASIFIIYRSESKGITKKFSDNSQALDRQEFANYRQSILDKATFYSNRLVKYLNDNQDKFDLYRSSSANQINRSTSFGGGIFLG